MADAEVERDRRRRDRRGARRDRRRHGDPRGPVRVSRTSTSRSAPSRPQPIMVGEARRMASEAFGGWNVPEERAELACLLVSEVVTNVVLHAATRERPAPGAGRRGAAAAVRGVLGRARLRGRGGRATRSSRCGCAGARSRSGSRCSTRTCACPGSAARGRTTRAAAAFTSSTSSPGAGGRDPPGKAKPSGSRFPPVAAE